MAPWYAKIFALAFRKILGHTLNPGFVNLFQRAEISKDIMEANSTLESKKIPDVSSWPINEYKMPRQKDG